MKKKYKSEIQALKRQHDKHRNPVSDFWANYKPRRDFGVYANEVMRVYKHNGLPVYQ